jgi:hypothetical protein
MIALIRQQSIGEQRSSLSVKNKWLLLESLSLSTLYIMKDNTRIDNLGCEKLRKTCFPAILEVSLSLWSVI